VLVDFATGVMASATESWQRRTFPVLAENALRQLIAVSPDLQTA
jgi:hypothetical protein